jgi:hypothetical protein
VHDHRDGGAGLPLNEAENMKLFRAVAAARGHEPQGHVLFGGSCLVADIRARLPAETLEAWVAPASSRSSQW